MLSGIGSGTSRQPQAGLDGLLGNLSSMLGGAGVGGLLNSGLGELLARFQQNGQGDAAESWVNDGPNKEISPPQLKQAIGPDILAALEQQTGLSFARASVGRGQVYVWRAPPGSECLNREEKMGLSTPFHEKDPLPWT